jgi:uncharacterized protein (DUF2141 family)
MNKKYICMGFLAFVSLLYVHGINVNLEITGIKINNGTIYVAVYSNEDDYNRENSFRKFVLEPENTTLNYYLELPGGEYVVTLFQDSNSNGKLDANIFGIPKEPVGITNYDGKGRPGGFQRLKVIVTNTAARIIVHIRNI